MPDKALLQTLSSFLLHPGGHLEADKTTSATFVTTQHSKVSDMPHVSHPLKNILESYCIHMDPFIVERTLWNHVVST